MTGERTANRAARLCMGTVFLVAGVAHFLRPRAFEQIVPHALPAKQALVYGTGALEITGGLALLTHRCSALVGKLMAAFLVAVFPANLNQAVHNIQFEDGPRIPRWLLWARLPLQAVLIALVLKATREGDTPITRQ